MTRELLEYEPTKSKPTLGYGSGFWNATVFQLSAMAACAGRGPASFPYLLLAVCPLIKAFPLPVPLDS